jgi:hypothetical protein
VKQKIHKVDFRTHKWDRMMAMLTGTVEKLGLSFITIGHDEASHLFKHWDYHDMVVYQVDAMQEESTPTKTPSDVMGGATMDHERDAVVSQRYDVANSIRPAGAALAAEYYTGKAGDAGRYARSQVTYRRQRSFQHVQILIDPFEITIDTLHSC